MAFGFSVLLLGSSSLSVPTYACRKGAGFCQAGKRQSRGPGGRSYHRLCMAGRAGGGDRGWGWNGQRRGASGGGPPGRAWGCAVCVAGLEKLPGSRVGAAVPWPWLGRAAVGGCPRRVGFWGLKDGYKGELSARGRRSEPGKKGGAQSGAEQSGEGILLPLALFLPP